MTSAALALALVGRNRCEGAAERSAELRSAKISSPELRFGDSDSRQQRPYKTLVNSGSGASDGA